VIELRLCLAIKSKKREGKLKIPNQEVSRSLRYLHCFFSHIWATWSGTILLKHQKWNKTAFIWLQMQNRVLEMGNRALETNLSLIGIRWAREISSSTLEMNTTVSKFWGRNWIAVRGRIKIIWKFMWRWWIHGERMANVGLKRWTWEWTNCRGLIVWGCLSQNKSNGLDKCLCKING